MRVAVTLIDRVVGSAVTEDGQHAVMRLVDVDGETITLGIPSAQLPDMINLSACVLAESERIQHQGVISSARTKVTWWTLHIDQESGDLLLSLTFGTGGTLCFSLPREMAAVLSDDLAARLERREPDQRGFGPLTC
jgi:hypothetical protein